MTAGPVFVLPSPLHLRAGATWVVVGNWSGACERRYGEVHLTTSQGAMTSDQLDAAASFHGSAVTRQPTRLAIRAETLLKDARSITRGIEHRRVLSRLELATPGQFVWQHHDPFLTAGSALADRLQLPLVQFVEAPCVWEAARWGTTRPGWGRLIERFGERPQLERADVVCCVSEEVARALDRLGVEEHRVLITPGTADPHDFAEAGGRREELGIEDATVVGWIGSFRRFHRLDVLIEAAAKARVRCPDLVLLLVGDGPDRTRVLALADELGVPTVAPGAVAHKEVADYILSCDLAVIPAGEGQEFHYSPLKLKEYMAAGKPVVAPALGEMARLLSDGKDVLLYEPGDVDGFADRILELATDAALRERIAEGAMHTVTSLFSIDEQLRELEAKLRNG